MDRINFYINGTKFSVGCELPSYTTLNEFIRRHAEMRGTKYMCLEGGCGACIVNVHSVHPSTQEHVSFSVNSCLVVIFSCDGWEITTVEGIGNRKIGYNMIQKRLDQYFGSQCGHCSPGFVMSMYSLIESTPSLNEAQVEKSFDGNLCRCTGYRPILDAFKSIVASQDENLQETIVDIEDVGKSICPNTGRTCNRTSKSEDEDWCLVNIQNACLNTSKKIALSDDRLWFEVFEIKSIFTILDEVGYDSYMLVGGNTARGVRPIKSFPRVLINITKVSDLHSHYMDVNLVLGASISLTDTLNLFEEISRIDNNFNYLKVLHRHIERVAHISVRNTNRNSDGPSDGKWTPSLMNFGNIRGGLFFSFFKEPIVDDEHLLSYALSAFLSILNVGTLAGNLILKHAHPDFPSDIFLLLDGVGATVTLVDRNLTEEQMDMNTFLKSNITGKVMTQIKLPPLSHNYQLVTYKVTPREQNAHAEVNSAFLFQFHPDSHKVVQARIVYGGICPTFTHAVNTETYLKGKNIFNNNILQGALKLLENEIQPNYDPPNPSPFYRKKVALSLYYKAILKICPKNILNPIYATGATSVTEDRPLISHGYQEYSTDPHDYPLTQPMLKKEGLLQCSGEAVYTDDMPAINNEVFGAFVLSTVAKADIHSIDATEALKVKGVITLLTAADIPGRNSFTNTINMDVPEYEIMLASEKVQYYNQPIAIIVANTMALANQVTYLVKVNYRNIQPAIFTIDDALNSPKKENRIKPYSTIMPSTRGDNIKKIVKGSFSSPRQYHFMLELHTTVTIPVDNGFEVHTATQWLDQVQSGISQVLSIPESCIIVKTRRCGGAFGCKYVRSNLAACASALVAKILNRPCRMNMHLYDIMRALGKRPNSRLDYEVGVDNVGEIQYMEAMWYVNDGISHNENECIFIVENFPNCYDASRWKVLTYGIITDSPTNCFMRAPGSIEAISGIEHIMDHISAEVGKDPVIVRMNNYNQRRSLAPLEVTDFLHKIDFSTREANICNFNANNRWKKRAINFTNMTFAKNVPGYFDAVVSVYHGDGSVILNIGGIEIGQGLFTRMAQVAAKELNVSVDIVTIIPSFNFATPNTFGTVASVTTECCAYSVLMACNQIKKRLGPVRVDLPNARWKEIVSEAYVRGIPLQASFFTGPNTPGIVSYPIFGLAAIEVEIDILTGRKWIVRADVFEDCGRSINPALDLGQVEGAFVQALSLWTLEDTIYNETTGKLYNYRTWNYKIYGAKDIPNDYRIYLKRNAVNPVGVLGSKAVSEPPSAMGHVIVSTLRKAIQASRRNSGYSTDEFIHIDVPVTNENVMKAANVRIEEFLLY